MSARSILSAGAGALLWAALASGQVQKDASNADMILDGSDAGIRFGHAVSAVQGTGEGCIGSIIIGAPRYINTLFASPLGDDAGLAEIFLTPSGFFVRGVKGDFGGAELGFSLDRIADLNNNGTVDVVIGAPGFPVPLAEVPYVLVQDGYLPITLYTFDTGGQGSRFGHAVSGRVDIDDDGTPDVLVATQQSNESTVFSGDDGTVIHSVSDIGGSAVGIGDLTNDDFGEFAMGYPLLDGVLTVYLGSNGDPHYTVFGNNGEAFGHAVAVIGDINSDGLPDLLVGAPSNADAGTDAGKIYFLSGANGTEITAAPVLLGEASNDRFGWSLANVGDTTGDGFDDFLVGSRDANRAYLYSGKTLRLVRRFDGENSGDQFGWSVAGGVDLNGDGYADVIIGAPGHDGDTGRAYVFFSPCRGDLNGDGVVDGTDQAALLFNWGACPAVPAPCPADLNGDGEVDSVDLAILLVNWGGCPAPCAEFEPDIDPEVPPFGLGPENYTQAGAAYTVPEVLAALNWSSLEDYVQWLESLDDEDVWDHAADLLHVIQLLESQ